MAFTHLQFNDQLQHGRLLRRWLNGIESAIDDGADILAVGPTMIDGDGSSAAQFPEVTTRFGFSDNATAKAAFDELNSLLSKFSGNGSVSNVNAALLQAINKFR